MSKSWTKLATMVYFQFIADEVTDCSKHQLMPLVIRYVDQKGEIQESFEGQDFKPV